MQGKGYRKNFNSLNDCILCCEFTRVRDILDCYTRKSNPHAILCVRSEKRRALTLPSSNKTVLEKVVVLPSNNFHLREATQFHMAT